MADIDRRLVRVGIEVSGRMRFYDQLAITAQGTKFANPNQGECTISITNLSQSVRDFIATETSPFNNNPSQKRIILEAGRESTGLSLLYSGNIFRSTIGQPPDQVITIKCLTGQFMKGRTVATALPGTIPLSRIVQQVATDAGLVAENQAPERNISNWNFTGSALKQIEKLADVPNINAFVDNDRLIVKNATSALTGRLRVLSPQTGLIGIPEPTDRGLKVTMLYDNQTQLGGALEIRSNRYQAFNGRYIIYKLGFSIANRDTPFYLIAEVIRQSV